MHISGISCFYHKAAFLLHNDDILLAAQEERFPCKNMMFAFSQKQ